MSSSITKSNTQVFITTASGVDLVVHDDYGTTAGNVFELEESSEILTQQYGPSGNSTTSVNFGSFVRNAILRVLATSPTDEFFTSYIERFKTSTRAVESDLSIITATVYYHYVKNGIAIVEQQVLNDFKPMQLPGIVYSTDGSSPEGHDVLDWRCTCIPEQRIRVQ